MSTTSSNMDDNSSTKAKTIKKAHDDLTSTFQKLEHLYDEVHMDGSMRAERLLQVCNYQNNLLQEIFTAEEQLIHSIGDELKVRRKAVNDLRALFNEDNFDESSFVPGSLALVKALHEEYNRLSRKRDQRLKIQKELFSNYELLCKRLGEKPEVIEGLNERFFSTHEMENLRSKYSESKRILNERLEKAVYYQTEAVKIRKIIDHSSAPVLTEDEQQYMNINLHNHTTVISTALLDKMECLCQKLKDQHDLWLEQVAFRYDELLVQFEDISEKCFMSPSFKHSLENIDPTKLNEAELKKLEEQVRSRKDRYEKARPVFDMLKEWMDSWKLKLDAERRVCRASFYKNRGGSLNQKLKQRKMLDLKVPKLLNDLHALCEKHEELDGSGDIIVDGLRADHYAARIVENYERERDLQRVQKQISTNKGPQTPGRAKNVFATTYSMHLTPTRSPAARKLDLVKLPKLTPTVGTNKQRKRSISDSQISLIYPLNPPVSSPFTSSPKPYQ